MRQTNFLLKEKSMNKINWKQTKRVFSIILSLTLALSMLVMVDGLLPEAAAQEPGRVTVGLNELTYSPGWTTAGSQRETETLAAFAEFTFTGRSVALIAPRGPDLGTINIYINGSFVSSANLQFHVASSNNIVFQSDDMGDGTYTVRLVNAAGKVAVNGLEFDSPTGAPRMTTISPFDPAVRYSPPDGASWDMSRHGHSVWVEQPGAWAELRNPVFCRGLDLQFGGWWGRGRFEIYTATAPTPDGPFIYPSTPTAVINTGASGGDFWWSGANADSRPGGSPQATPSMFGPEAVYAKVRVVYIGQGEGAWLALSRFSTNGTSWNQTTSTANHRGMFNWSVPRSWTEDVAGGFAQTPNAGMFADYTFEGSSIAWLSDKGPGRGTARVFINGVYADSVDLSADAAIPAGKVFEHNFGADNVGPHTIRIVNESGTIRNYGFQAELKPEPARSNWSVAFRPVGGSLVAGTAGDYAPGTVLDIAVAPREFITGDFIGWYALNGTDAMFGDSSKLATTFTVPATGGGDITLIALFELLKNPYAYPVDFNTDMYKLDNNRVGTSTSVIGSTQFPGSLYILPDSDVSMTVNGFPVPVFDQAQSVKGNHNGRNPFRTARFEMDKDEEVEIEVTWHSNVQSVIIYPTPYNIDYEITGPNTFKFTLKTALKVRVDVNGVHSGLTIFPDPREENPPKLGDPFVVNVLDYIGIDYLEGRTGTSLSGDVPKPGDKGFRDVTLGMQAAIDAVSAMYDPEVGQRYTLFMPDGVFRFGTIYIKSNMNLYLSSGTVLLGAYQRADYHLAYHYEFEDRVAAWIRIVDAHDIKIFGRGIIDANARDFARGASPNRRVIPLFINGQEWDPETEARPRVLSFNNTQGGWPGGNAAIHQANRHFVETTHSIEVEDLLLIDGAFYNSAVTSARDVTFTNFKVNVNSYYAGGPGNETDGFKINSSYNVVFQDGWLTGGDDPFTIAACGPTAFGDAYNNVVKDTVFCVYEAGYTRFAFTEYGFGYYDNLFTNIFCIESPAGYEVLKAEDFPGYHYDGPVYNNTFSDWYIDPPQYLLKYTIGGFPSFRFRGMWDITFDRFVMNSLVGNSQFTSTHPNTRSEFLIRDLFANGKYIDNARDAFFTNVGNPPANGTLKLDFELTGRTWVDIKAGTLDGTAIGYTDNSATFTFTGQQVRVLATKGPGKGTADIYIDHRLVQTVDLEADEIGRSGVVFDSGPLHPSIYTITVVYSNEVNLDAFSFDKHLPGLIRWDEVDVTETEGRLGFSEDWIDNGDHFRTSDIGAWSDFSFVGSKGRLNVLTGPDMGKANIYVNGRFVQVVDLYSAAEEVRAIYTTTENLWEMRNTIRIVSIGEKNPLSTGTDITVVGGANPPAEWLTGQTNVEYSEGWSAPAGGVRTSDVAGSSLELTFVGGGFRWVGNKGSDGGIANVYINGELAGVVDTKSEAAVAGAVLFEAADLIPGSNSVKIVVVSGEIASRGIHHLGYKWTLIEPTSADIRYSGAGWARGEVNAWRCSNPGSWVAYEAKDVTSLAYMASNWGDRGRAQIIITDANGVEIDYSQYTVVRHAWNNNNNLPRNQVDTSRGNAGHNIDGVNVMWRINGLPRGDYTIRVECMGIGGSEGNIQINFLGFSYGTGTTNDGTNMLRILPSTGLANGQITYDGDSDGKFWQSEAGGQYMTAKLNSNEYGWFEYTFTGPGIAWLNRGGSGRPVAQIFLNDMAVPVATYNHSTGSSTIGRVFEATGLDPTVEHKLRVYAHHNTGSGTGERWFTNFGLEIVEYPNLSSIYELDFFATVGGTITVDLEGSDVEVGSEIAVTAEPDEGYVFARWVALAGAGDGKVFEDALVTDTLITIPAGDLTLVAFFVPLDLSEMEAAIEEAKALILEVGDDLVYTAETWAAFLAAFEKLYDLYNNFEWRTLTEINDAMSDYLAVFNALELRLTDAELLQSLAAGILRNGLRQDQLHLSANNRATLTLVLPDREIVLATNVNNRNVSGQIVLPDGSGTLIFDIKGNGSNIKVWTIIPAEIPVIEPPVTEPPAVDDPIIDDPVTDENPDETAPDDINPEDL